ncbi:site-specific integrase [Alkalihalobacterium chitinilyticum]|uniref:Tyrosine-type recombinase/integrase n=1 Tax=Alkalihalobacterium chitinilyticum TaxID=2980103 RepID=A0ABT5VJ77_9BACI|nr:site-specific integrase [Alkalihalobacterium chitinilyticum]MDE5415503.1 tyrosine-type recombinase/integrase [Alkalihalobacterium chitinilyticum]
MASIQKRGKTYQYTVSHYVNGKAQPLRKGGFRTKKEAQIAGAEVEAQLSKGIVPHLMPAPIDEYFDKWVKLYKSTLSVTTQRHYQYTSKAIKAYFGSTPLQEITRHDYQMFLNEYGSNKARETVEKLNTHIRACVKDAVEEQIIHHDFTRKAKLTWTTPSKRSIEKHLNYQESELLLREIRNRLDKGLGYSLLLLALTSGMRFAELVGLTRSDFDFVKNTITISKTWGYMKRSPEGFGPTKNEQSNRTIKMDQRTMLHFKKLFASTPNNIHKLVFYSPKSKYKVICNTAANNLLKKVLTELGIEPITMHGLRHTHASVLLYKKVSIYYVSERLGHSDIETTLKEYTHVIKELREEDELGTVKTFEEMVV